MVCSSYRDRKYRPKEIFIKKIKKYILRIYISIAGPVNFLKSFLHCYFIYHYKERCHYQWARIKPRTEEWQIIIWFSSFTDSNSPANGGKVWEGLTNRKALRVRGSGLVELRANPYLSFYTFLPPSGWAGQAGSEWEPHFLLSSEGKTVSSQSSSSCQGWRWWRLKAVRRSGRRSNWRKAISRNSRGLWTTARWQQGSSLTVSISGNLAI